jgi:diguanylate cyclase (GGDEF)-like protein
MSASLQYLWRKLRFRSIDSTGATSATIVGQSTAHARRIAALAIGGAALFVAIFVVDRFMFSRELQFATRRLVFAERAAGEIHLADERLTMSANMAAATAEPRWVERYDANIPLIDSAIGRAMQLAPPDSADRFDSSTKVANDELVELERQSFAAVAAGDLPKARAILDGPEYGAHKATLSQGTQRLITEMVTTMNAEVAALNERTWYSLTMLFVLCATGAWLLWFRLSSSLARSELAFLDAEQKIRSLALHDPLTGLANRAALREALQAAIARAERRKSGLSVLMIDLDRFKPVNDRLGHLEGDLVLKEVAQRLTSTLRQGEIRARYGGDEFVAVIEHDGDDSAVTRVAERLIEALSRPIELARANVEIGASIGVATFPRDGHTEHDLLRKADHALYRAKGAGGAAASRYDAAMDSALDARLVQEEELRLAIAHGHVIPYFQPIVDMMSRNILCLEVLARWNHPVRGVLLPAEFMPLIESAGLMRALTVSILQGACLALRDIPGDVPIAINVAPELIQDERLTDLIITTLAQTGTPSGRLEVELTETALVSNISAAKRVIASLKGHGIKVALDDFGTGYSSLCYLSELPFDKIKIDRSFVRSLHDREESAKIVNAIVGLGESLGVPTVAEGVETERDVHALRKIGCKVAQGFLYSRPLPAGEIAALLHRPRGLASLAETAKLRILAAIKS